MKIWPKKTSPSREGLVEAIFTKLNDIYLVSVTPLLKKMIKNNTIAWDY